MFINLSEKKVYYMEYTITSVNGAAKIKAIKQKPKENNSKELKCCKKTKEN